MCIKIVYHNTYSDGLSDITERVEACTPGFLCAHPRVVQYDREYGCSRDKAKARQARGDIDHASSECAERRERAGSGGSDASGSSAAVSSSAVPERRRSTRRSGVYINGTRVAPSSAAEASLAPAAARPIPIKRASTLPYNTEPLPTRGRAPIIVEERLPSAMPPMMPPRLSPRLSPRIPAAAPFPPPVDVFESSPRRRLHHPRASPRLDDLRDLRSDFRADPPPPRRASPLRQHRRSGGSGSGSGSGSGMGLGLGMGMGLGLGLDDPLMPSPMPPMAPLAPPMMTSALNDNFLSPHRPRPSPRDRADFGPLGGIDRSPPGYASAEDDRERAERRRRRRLARERAAVLPSSLPAFGNTDVQFGSSYDSASGAGSTGVSTGVSTSASGSPAVNAVKKELRWEDEMRRQQNERIRRRPRLQRDQVAPDAAAASGSGARTQGEVKSILKNTTATTTTPPPPPASPPSRRRSSSSRRSSFAGGDPFFATGLADLNIRSNSNSNSNGTAAATAGSAVAGGSDLTADVEDRSRLRNRFSMPPRRYTAGGSFRRRSEIWYPDEGRYRMM